MADYQEMYLMMARETEKAITLTEQAVKILIAAQCECEEIYINSPEPIIKLLVKDADAQQDEQVEVVPDTNYTEDEKHKIENILKAFTGFIREQDYFDIVYSEKIGYVYLLTQERGIDPVTELRTSQETIDTLFRQVVGEVMFGPGNQHMGQADGMSEYEVSESRRRLTAIVETMEEDRDDWLAYIDEYLEDYQDNNK